MQLTVQSPYAFFDEFFGIELDGIYRFPIDSIPEFLKLFLVEVLVDGNGFLLLSFSTRFVLFSTNTDFRSSTSGSRNALISSGSLSVPFSTASK